VIGHHKNWFIAGIIGTTQALELQKDVGMAKVWQLTWNMRAKPLFSLEMGYVTIFNSFALILMLPLDEITLPN